MSASFCDVNSHQWLLLKHMVLLVASKAVINRCCQGYSFLVCKPWKRTFLTSHLVVWYSLCNKDSGVLIFPHHKHWPYCASDEFQPLVVTISIVASTFPILTNGIYLGLASSHSGVALAVLNTSPALWCNQGFRLTFSYAFCLRLGAQLFFQGVWFILVGNNSKDHSLGGRIYKGGFLEEAVSTKTDWL